ncbi:MAG: PIN domain-containing protein [candidate division WOR-3 bacterium]
MTYIVDTHVLVWFLTGSKQLSKTVTDILKKREIKIIIPTIVLAELKYLHKRKKIPISFEKVKSAIDEDERCVIFPLNEDIIDVIPTQLDIHDGIICGTAILFSKTLKDKVAILSRDREIKDSQLVQVIW